MISKDEALTADEFHWGNCTRIVGPRGGVRESSYVARRNGRTQTWKRSPERYRVPVKRGLYEYGDITPDRAHEWHTPATCPLNHVQGPHTAVAHQTRVQPVTVPILGPEAKFWRGVCTCNWAGTEYPDPVIAENDIFKHLNEVLIPTVEPESLEEH